MEWLKVNTHTAQLLWFGQFYEKCTECLVNMTERGYFKTSLKGGYFEFFHVCDYNSTNIRIHVCDYNSTFGFFIRRLKNLLWLSEARWLCRFWVKMTFELEISRVKTWSKIFFDQKLNCPIWFQVCYPFHLGCIWVSQNGLK